MKKAILVASVFIFLLSSCTKTTELDNIDEAGIETTEVSINLEIQSEQSQQSSSSNEVASKSGSFTRGDAPVHVAGVLLTASYVEEASNNPVIGNFDFVDMGAEHASAKVITMAIPLGSNVIDVVSKSTYRAENTVYANEIELASKEDKLADYSAKLIKEQGIYAVFNGTTTKTITETDKTIALTMTTNHTRYSVVLETSAIYDVQMNVTCDKRDYTVTANTAQQASAIVLNDAELTGTNDVTVVLNVYAHGSDTVLKTRTYVCKTKPAMNSTLVVNYNADGKFVLVETGLSFSWNPMTDEGEVVNL